MQNLGFEISLEICRRRFEANEAPQIKLSWREVTQPDQAQKIVGRWRKKLRHWKSS